MYIIEMTQQSSFGQHTWYFAFYPFNAFTSAADNNTDKIVRDMLPRPHLWLC